MEYRFVKSERSEKWHKRTDYEWVYELLCGRVFEDFVFLRKTIPPTGLRCQQCFK